MLSFSMAFKGLPADFLGIDTCFCRFALGGVFESKESSWKDFVSGSEFSSSSTGEGRFFAAVLVVRVVCVGFEAGFVFGAGTFLGTAFLIYVSSASKSKY